MNKIKVIITLRILLLTIMITFISSCNGEPENPLIGKWRSDNFIEKLIKGSKYKPEYIEFDQDSLIMKDKVIPVIYKIKDKTIILFSRGEKTVVAIMGEDEIELFLMGLGKKTYIRLDSIPKG
jgi:hypothetical protein